MPRIIFRSPDGTCLPVDAEPGDSLMRAAITHGIDGIAAECGGSLACGTCQVVFDPADLPRLPPMAAAEAEMLAMVAPDGAVGRRLGCQIPVTSALEGVVVTVAEDQG